jgi:hypothetical protein
VAAVFDAPRAEDVAAARDRALGKVRMATEDVA